MERFCSKCGTLVSGEGAFCPQCGAPLESAVNLSKTPISGTDLMPSGSSSSYNQSLQPVPTNNTYNSSGNSAQMPNYPQSSNVVSDRTENMTIGQWLGTVILTTWFGLISLILLFVWAFGDTPQPKKNYCRAMLIVEAIGVGVGILIGLFFILVPTCLGISAGGLEEFFENYMYY